MPRTRGLVRRLSLNITTLNGLRTRAGSFMTPRATCPPSFRGTCLCGYPGRALSRALGPRFPTRRPRQARPLGFRGCRRAAHERAARAAEPFVAKLIVAPVLGEEIVGLVLTVATLYQPPPLCTYKPEFAVTNA